MTIVNRTVGLLTRSGFAAVAIGIGAYVAGWQLGWVELMVVAGACLVALMLAVPFVLGRSHLRLSRTISPQRVRAGDTSIAELRAVNESRVSSRRVEVNEFVGSRSVSVEIPGLSAGADHVAVYPLPTERRGAITVGPAVVTRSDPAGLLRRQVAHTSVETLWVHPRWRLVRPLSAGFAKDLEGPTADDSPAGDIAFHTVRAYQVGDDPRHIHWMSSARVGQVMVRQYVDNRRPHLTVVVDPSPRSWTDDEFEVGIEVAASLVVSSMSGRLPVSARVGREWIAGRANPADSDRALDRFTTCATREEDRLVLTVADALRVEYTTSVLALITAGTPLAETLACIAHARRSVRVIVIDVSADPTHAVDRDSYGNSDRDREPDRDPNGDRDGGRDRSRNVVPAGRPGFPGARSLRAHDLDQFVNGWNRMVR